MLDSERIRLGGSHAYALFEALFKESGSRIEILKKLLPRMIDSIDGKMLLDMTGATREEVAQLRGELGVAFNPLTGLYNGCYTLDLSRAMDRHALARLLELSNVTALKLKEVNIGDTSQNGDFSCFRNELLNGKRYKILPDAAETMAHVGILEFDFVYLGVAPLDDEAMTDRRCADVQMSLRCEAHLNYQIHAHAKSHWSSFNQSVRDFAHSYAQVPTR
jgi:hypothetical protein